MAMVINAATGLPFTDIEWQEATRQSLVDRLVTPLGARAYRPDYGLASALPRELTLSVAEGALEGGVGPVRDLTAVVRTDDGIRADVVVAPPPPIAFHSVWSRRYGGGSGGRHYDMGYAGGDRSAPLDWVETGATMEIGRLTFRVVGDEAAFRVIFFTAAERLWDADSPGYADQYAGWQVVIRAGAFSQAVPLLRPGAPIVQTFGGRQQIAYRWNLPDGYLRNFVRYVTARAGQGLYYVYLVKVG